MTKMMRGVSSIHGVAGLQRLLHPKKIEPVHCPQTPRLKLKSEQQLLKHWWSQSPFPITEPLLVPVFSFKTAAFLNKAVELPQDIFNNPLRRDLMHRLYDYRIKLNKFTTKVTRNRGMTVGSRKKVRAQKGSGKARMGDKRAPHLRKGGKAHGSKAKVYSYTLNGKIKLAALKALLSAKLAEGRIRIVDTEELPEPKTRPLSKILQLHNADDRTLFCVLTHKCPDTNFELAHKNIKQVFWHDSYSLDVLTLFRADKILITVSGLNELVNNINKTAYMLGRQPHMPKLEQKQEEEEEEVDPTKPYEFKFKILAEYLERYEKAKQEKPDLVRAEMLGVRKIDVKI